MLNVFIKLTLAIAVGIVALIVALLIFKVVLFAAIVAGVVIGGLFVFNLVRRTLTPVNARPVSAGQQNLTEYR